MYSKSYAFITLDYVATYMYSIYLFIHVLSCDILKLRHQFCAVKIIVDNFSSRAFYYLPSFLTDLFIKNGDILDGLMFFADILIHSFPLNV